MTTTTYTNLGFDWVVFRKFRSLRLPGILGKNLGGTSETSEKSALQSDVKLPKLATMPSWFDLRQIRDLYHYEYIKIEKDIAKLGGRVAYSVAQRQGGNLRRFQALFERRNIVLGHLHHLEPLLGLNVYSNIK